MAGIARQRERGVKIAITPVQLSFELLCSCQVCPCQAWNTKFHVYAKVKFPGIEGLI